MTRPPCSRMLALGLIVIGHFLHHPVLAADVIIGTSRIVIPELHGFSFLAPDSPIEHPFAERLGQQCSPPHCAAFARETANSQSPQWDDIPPYLEIQVLGDDVVVDHVQFSALKQAAKSDISGLREIISDSLTEAAFDAFVESPEGTLLELVDSPFEVADEVHEGDSFLAVSIVASNNYRQTDGSMVSYSLEFTSGVIHVGDKLVTVLICGPRKESDWGISAFQDIASQVVRANDGTAVRSD